MLLAACCLLFGVSRLMVVMMGCVRSSLFVVCCLLCDVRCALFAVCCVLFIVLLFVVWCVFCCVLAVGCCLVSVVCYVGARRLSSVVRRCLLIVRSW